MKKKVVKIQLLIIMIFLLGGIFWGIFTGDSKLIKGTIGMIILFSFTGFFLWVIPACALDNEWCGKYLFHKKED